MANETKGITVKIDAELHAEVKRYLEENSMTMAEFVTRAIENELHPKIEEENKVEKMRTLAFQVPESLFQRIKGYLARNGVFLAVVGDRTRLVFAIERVRYDHR